MEIKFHCFNLELKDTFRISYGSRNFQPSLVMEVLYDGYSGYGEAAATSYYGITVEKMIAEIKEVETLVNENIDLTPEELWEITNPHIRENSFAQCALDIAIHDLYGKRKDLPLYKLWGLTQKNYPVTSYTIGIDSVEKMAQKIKDFPWPLYKIKLGTEEDIFIIKELRKHTSSVFRIDANAAWKADETIENSKILKGLNVEFIEQPLAVNDFEGMKEVYEKSALPVIADESCYKESDIEKCKGCFHGVNIKLTKCGGLTPAKRMITAAKKAGMKVMVGCMTESTVGISAIAQLLPLLDYVDMDGALLLKEDIADGVKICKNGVHFPARNGTGANLLRNYSEIR